MPAVVAATVTTPEMIGGGEDHQSIGVEIIISGNDSQWTGRGLLTMKRHHTVAAEARAVARFDRHTFKQFKWDVD